MPDHHEHQQSSNDKVPKKLNTSAEEHTDVSTTDLEETPSVAREHRRYQVSSNRGSATHRVRYVESGGGEDENCRVCKPTPKPR